MKITFIGSGNLATNLSEALYRKGFRIAQVYSHTAENARKLGAILGCPFTDDPARIDDDSDLYIFSVKDTALHEIIRKIKPNDGLWVHTAGSIPMSVFEGHARRYGVFYPLQTFSKDKEVDFAHIPFFIEAATPADYDCLHGIASQITEKIVPADSGQRQYIHLSAVFACNFTNHMYAIAARLLEEHDIPFDILQPLIRETAEKIKDLPPVQAQTGPAVRYDENVMNKQAGLLDDCHLEEIYRLLSKSIHRFATENKSEQS